MGNDLTYHAKGMVHRSSFVETGAEIGDGTKIWHFCNIAKTALIGENCNIGQGCYIAGIVGNNVKIQNNVSVFEGVQISNNCFIGPSVVFTNVKYPIPGEKSEYTRTIVNEGVVIGANATILCGITIGKGAFIGAGAVVIKDVPEGMTVKGVFKGVW